MMWRWEMVVDRFTFVARRRAWPGLVAVALCRRKVDTVKALCRRSVGAQETPGRRCVGAGRREKPAADCRQDRLGAEVMTLKASDRGCAGGRALSTAACVHTRGNEPRRNDAEGRPGKPAHQLLTPVGIRQRDRSRDTVNCVNQTDTIVAISSAAGSAARAIVRLSGPMARSLVETMAGMSLDWPGGSARLVRLGIRGAEVPAWLYLFRAPRSYTGEDTVELHLPGNPLLARWVVEDLIHRGARMAEPGEFTARAYFNGRLDLTEAEGVAATIAASNEAELAAARQLMAGELSRRLAPVMDRLAETLALLEVGIDFSDEDVTFLSDSELRQRLSDVRGDLQRLVSESARFERLSHEPRIVLVGRPNAGKSTLLNALAGSERAIVSPQAGTTRDALSAEVKLASGMVTIIDVAGLEAFDGDDSDGEASAEASIAAQMRRRALEAVREADRVVLVHDLTDPGPPVEAGRTPDLVVRTKVDLLDDQQQIEAGEDERECRVSAATGQGMEALRRRLNELAFGGQERSTLALNTRHLQCIDEAVAATDRALHQAGGAVEVVALELRSALDALGGVLGVITPDDLLGRVFSRFCIGK